MGVPEQKRGKLSYSDLPTATKTESGVRLKPPSGDQITTRPVSEPPSMMGKFRRMILRAKQGIERSLESIDELDKTPTPVPPEVVIAEFSEGKAIVAPRNDGGNKKEAA